MENQTQISSILFHEVSDSKLESNVEMPSNVQNIEEQSQSSNENTCEKPFKPHSSCDINPTTIIQTIEEGENLFNMNLENFPTSIIEIMLFKLEANGEIAAHKLFKRLSGTHVIKTSAVKSWVSDIEFARMKT